VPEVALESFLAAHTDASLNAATDALRDDLRRVRGAFAADAAAACTLAKDRARCFFVEGDGAAHQLTAGHDLALDDDLIEVLHKADGAVVFAHGLVWIMGAHRDGLRIAIVVAGARTTTSLDITTSTALIDVAHRCARHIASAPVFDLTVDRASRVQRVLDDELFLIVFQPVVDLRRGTTAALEAFSRFPAEPVRGPRAWFSEAAEIGLGVALELAALRHALRSLDDLPADARLAINISASTASSRAFLDALTAMPVDRIILEIDGFAATDVALVAGAIEPARDAGLLVAVHELRTGSIDVERLVTLRPDVVKLDGGIVDRVDSDPVARGAVRATVGLLRAHDIDACRVVATNVERRGQLDTLTLLGVDWGQGYYLGRPAHVRVPRART